MDVPYLSKYQLASSPVNQPISESEDDEDMELGKVDNRSDASELNVDDILDFE